MHHPHLLHHPSLACCRRNSALICRCQPPDSEAGTAGRGAVKGTRSCWQDQVRLLRPQLRHAQQKVRAHGTACWQALAHTHTHTYTAQPAGICTNMSDAACWRACPCAAHSCEHMRTRSGQCALGDTPLIPCQISWGWLVRTKHCFWSSVVPTSGAVSGEPRKGGAVTLAHFLRIPSCSVPAHAHHSLHPACCSAPACALCSAAEASRAGLR